MAEKMKTIIPATLTFIALTLLATNVFAWGAKELENEKDAIVFSAEVARGHYKVVSTPDVKKWLDEKKDLLLVDTMPYEDSFKKNHIPGAKQMEFPIPEMTSLDDKTKANLGKTPRCEQKQTDRFLLRIYQMHPQPQRRDVGGQARL